MDKNFILTGAAGYIAPRHLKAIKETGNHLLAVVDPHDSVGVLDSHFHHVAYFREFERFDRHIDKLIYEGTKIDYISICSPNYLHDAHIRFGLRIGADVICEKPLAINPWNCDALKEMEQKYNRKVNTILQLRLHPSIISLKNRIIASNDYKVQLKYITSRGPWYLHSWKGNIEQSGGLATNIGIHFFDMLMWIFGAKKECKVFESKPDYIKGFLALERANVDWELSTDYNILPDNCKKANKTTYRSIIIDSEEIEFSDGFADLHTLSYKNILEGNGFGIDDAYPSVTLTHEIRELSKKL